ncbi:MAG: hypothetical protein K2X93_08435 [Candidatus Obscuribacterales bacterium]|nr:hypothetical protein [Candidatus Obscuribacterales bacterium]
MQRSHFSQPSSRVSKTSLFTLLLSTQLLLSSTVLPLPVVAAESVSLDSAVTAGSANDAGAAAIKLLSETTAVTPEAESETTKSAEFAKDEQPVGWESSANDFIKQENDALSTGSDNKVNQKTESATSEKSAAGDSKTSTSDTNESAKAEAPSTADSKQIADKTADKTQGEPVEVGTDGADNKNGIGGFVGENGDGDVALLEQGFVESNVRETLGEVIVIDNDEAVEMEETIAYEELPTDEGKTKIKSGAQFPVVMVSQITSKTIKKGDNIQARLKYDLKIAERLVANRGDVVVGHIDYVLPARSVLHSLVSPNRWYKNSGCIGVRFDEIINKKKEHIALNAMPAQKARIVRNKAEGRELGVNHSGQITGPWAQQLRYKALRIGLNFALAPAGVFSFGAMPVALGVIGAANPSFAFMKPVGTNVRHRRIKGFAWGFLSGIPGSWIIEDTVTKGQEAIIKPGDEFLVELKEEFTGEARTEAQLLPGSSAKVKGQVVKDPKASKPEKKSSKKK